MADRVNTVSITCSHCGMSAVRWVSGGKPAAYCGNACKVAAHKARRGRTNQRARIGINAIRRMPALVQTADRRIRVIKAKMDMVRRRKAHRCRQCGCGLDGFNLKIVLCSICLDANRKAHKRASRLSRRASERAALVERFDPLEVLARDGWRCHLCGVSTPRKLRGTYHDRAPELDHIVPLAAGGEHTRQNTACACRRCNIVKADKPLGQLRLVA